MNQDDLIRDICDLYREYREVHGFNHRDARAAVRREFDDADIELTTNYRLPRGGTDVREVD